MNSRTPPLRSLHKTPDTILNIKPPKRMDRILRFKQDEGEKQVLKHRFNTYHQFSFINHGVLNHDLKPQKLIFRLKQLKSVKYLTLDLVYLLQIPEDFIAKILSTLRYMKGLSVLHFQLGNVSSPQYDANFHSFSKALKEIHKFLKVQARLSVEVAGMNNSDGERLSVLLESFRKLERFTFLNLAFKSSQDFTPIQETIQILKASKSLIRFSLTFEQCKLCPCVRLHELFLILKDIKPLKYSEIRLKESDIPSYDRLKSILPYLEEVGQNANVTIIFEYYRHEMTRYERLSFTKLAQNLKFSHRIQVQFIENFRFSSSCHQSMSIIFSKYCTPLPAVICRIVIGLILLSPLIAFFIAVPFISPGA